MYNSFVSAFSGKRASFEFAVALFEANILKKHVSDLYTLDWTRKYLEYLDNNIHINKYLSRNNKLLSSQNVYISKRTFLYSISPTYFKKILKLNISKQNSISKVALDLAIKNNSGLFLYAGYGHYAFTNDRDMNRPKGIIQYHPHILESSRILIADLKKYKYLSNAYEEIKNDMKVNTNIIELNLANKIICHSKFTEKTIIKAGISKEKILNVPYGINPTYYISQNRDDLIYKQKKCRFLFVGQGIHRKGLHHLLIAWKKANLKFSNLNIVSRYLDPQITANAKMIDNLTYLNKVSDNEKKYLYSNNDVFVMPSLIEGFGYVYLEALSHGCFCIGTKNTGLDDISSNSTSRIIEAGDVKNLSIVLKELEEIALTKGFDRSMIRSSIRKYSWEKYRIEVSNAAKELLSADNF